MTRGLRLALVLCLGCAARSAPAAPPPVAPEPLVAMPMTPPPVGNFVDGPAIADPAAVLAWLDADKGRRVQLPVVVRFDEHRLAVTEALLGVPPDALALKLDDSTMGIALIDHLRTVCPPGPTCAVWLEGTWGPAMADLPDFGDKDGRHDFTVRRVLGVADANATKVRGQRK